MKGKKINPNTKLKIGPAIEEEIFKKSNVSRREIPKKDKKLEPVDRKEEQTKEVSEKNDNIEMEVLQKIDEGDVKEIDGLNKEGELELEKKIIQN
ncbi:hypothetical protein CDL15_Pgr011844 [Punica granatum]|uniref:Uncharacterized protein n=1 Tax=Punica granatum TaxID=22663 RepID=A0A218XFP7_PUNGR|nr:hypothetical protein CDL15_Pgr011844 [Punica granatum]